MKLKDKLSQSRIMRLFAAALINAVLLGVILLLIQPGFESNDDQTLSAFVDGQMALKDAYMPYINIVMASLLKLVFTVFGDSVAWFSVIQFILLYSSFTVLTWIFIERLGLWQGAFICTLLVLFTGVSCYVILNYTKTASMCTVAGLALILFAMENMEKGRRGFAVTAGAVLTLCSAMLRFTEFLPCAALMSVIGLRHLCGIIADKGCEKKLKEAVSYLTPFLLVLAISLALYAVDELAWCRAPYKAYHDFDASRVALTDYGVPKYELMPDAYDALGLNENAVSLFSEGNFYEPQLFSKEIVDGIITARSEAIEKPSLGECLGILLDNCLPTFFNFLHTYPLLFMLILWLSCGKHELRDWFAVAAEFGMFCLFYLYLIYKGRYLIMRVDAGLFTAIFVCLAWMLRPKKLAREKLLSLCLLCIALYTSFRMSRGFFRTADNSEIENRAEWKAAVDTILSDDEHLYLCKFGPLDKAIYSAFEPMPAQYWDKIVLMGGWPTQHPHIAATLAQYGIENPYRDAVDNDSVYIIDDRIDATLKLINDYYNPAARAELIEDISAETGLEVYRIIS